MRGCEVEVRFGPSRATVDSRVGYGYRYYVCTHHPLHRVASRRVVHGWAREMAGVVLLGRTGGRGEDGVGVEGGGLRAKIYSDNDE